MFVVGVGGTHREGSSTELVVRSILRAAETRGAETAIFTGAGLDLPLYRPGIADRTENAQALVEALRRADAVVLGSPGYHGGISGSVKNALDYVEDMVGDARPYFDGVPVACVATGAGFQGANAALTALRNVVHALRGWPTPLGLALNTSTPLFDRDGRPLDAALGGQFEMIAGQLTEFATGNVGVSRRVAA